MVIYRRLQLRFRRLGRLSLLGDGLAERLRSTSLGILGVATAVGLGVVALALRQEFPLLGVAPLPDPQPVEQRIDDRVAVAPAGVTGATKREGAEAPSAADDASPLASPQEGTAGLADPAPSGGETDFEPAQPPAGNDQGRRRPPAERPPAERPRAERPPANTPPVEETPVSTVAPTEEPETTPDAVVEPPPVAPSPSPAEPSHPGNGNAYGKGNGNAHGKGNGLGNGGVPPSQAAGGKPDGPPEE